MRFKKLITIPIILVVFLLLAFIVKGNKDVAIKNQTEEEMIYGVGSPFESTGSTSRYMLVKAIVDDNTFFFDDKKAKASAPDLVWYNGKYFSIFTPGVSFIAIPFYLFGSYVGFPQLATFSLTIIVSIINFLLVSKISRKVGAGFFTSFIAGIIFLFATNGLPYSLTLTQHHLSTLILLLALNNVLSKRTLTNNLSLGILFGVGALVDIPNIFILLPLILYAVFNHFDVDNKKLKLKINLKLIALGIGVLPLMVLFAFYNHSLTGSYFKLGQTIGRSDYPVNLVKVLDRASKDGGISLPLNSRIQLHGLQVSLFNTERAIWFYSPVILFGVFGLYYLWRDEEKRKLVLLSISTMLMIIVFYSMHGDPWGGWAFGDRYMIPVYALLTSGVAIFIDKFKKNIPVMLFFLCVLIYSLGVNVLGAMTTTQIPPKVEAVALSKPIPYTYRYNWDLMNKGLNSSLFYDAYLKDSLTSKDYLILYTAIVLTLITILYTGSLIEERSAKK